MKILKIVGMILLIVGGLYLLIALVMPSTTRVERSLLINAYPYIVFAEVIDLKKWQKWDPWVGKDTTLVATYSDNTVGVGAWVSWTSEIEENGKYTIVEAKTNRFIRARLEFEESSTVFRDSWKFEASGDGCMTTWAFEGEFDFWVRPMGLMMDLMVGGEYEQGLAKLDSLCSLVPKIRIPSLESGIKLEELPMEIPMFAIKDSSKPEEMYAKIIEVITEIKQYMAEVENKAVGDPYVIYYKSTPEVVIFQCCVPSEYRGETSGRIEALKRSEGLLLTKVHHGAYFGLAAKHEVLVNFLMGKDSDFTLIGQAYEVFNVGPLNESDSSKWITTISYPVVLKNMTEEARISPF